MNRSTSVRVNLPPAWRCVKPIGPRASRKSLWPASCRRLSRSCTCFADAGGPCCCPNAMWSSLADGCNTTVPTAEAERSRDRGLGSLRRSHCAGAQATFRGMMNQWHGARAQHHGGRCGRRTRFSQSAQRGRSFRLVRSDRHVRLPQSAPSSPSAPSGPPVPHSRSCLLCLASPCCPTDRPVR